MDATTTWLVVYGVGIVALASWCGWLHHATVKWNQVHRVKITLAEQEEALSSLFDKLNTVLARWRKREQRAEKKEDHKLPPTPDARKAELRSRFAELRGLPARPQLSLMEGFDDEHGDQGSTSH